MAAGSHREAEQIMNCDKVQTTLSALADGELNRWHGWRVRRHLARCPECAAAYQQVEVLGEAARSWHDVAAPAALQARISAALAASSPRAHSASHGSGTGRPARVKESLWM